MIKTIAKETGIVILLILAVALILGILFYEYIPTNKIVPIKLEEYLLPQEMQEELKETIEAEQNIVRTYSIDSSDLTLYESTKEYNKGKANPFADYTLSNTTTANNVTNNSTNTSEKFFNTVGK